MNFYSEWEARHRYEDHLRSARRRDGWNLQSGLLPHEEGQGVSAFFRRLFGGSAPVGEASRHVVESHAGKSQASARDGKKAS